MRSPGHVLTLSTCVLILSSALAAAVPAGEVSLRVAPGGSDQGSGQAGAPLATPAAALARAAQIAHASPDVQVRVVLQGGRYYLAEPLVIGPRHVPAGGRLVFRSAEGQQAVISGGQPITGWSVHADGSWSVRIPEAADGRWSFRELFVNGQRRPRARHPNAGFLRVDEALADKRSGFTFSPGDLPGSWSSGGELVFLHDWSTSRIPVAEVEHPARRLTVRYPIGNQAEHYRIDGFEPHPRYFVEGHPALLDAPGEWLLDAAGLLTYRPLPGEQPETAEVFAPRAAGLLVVSGDDAAPIRHVHFDRLHWEHCAWPLPEQGFAGSQATAHELRAPGAAGGPRGFVPAALRFERAADCSFTRGRIAHLGTSGIQFGSQTRRCRLEDTVIEDVAGNGVNLGEDTRRNVAGGAWWQAAPDQAATGHLVEHNRIEHCGQQFLGAVAVWVGLARDMTISRNEIAHHPYTGVSVGWMWNPSPTPAGGHLVSQNRIHHVMLVLSDGGGIYTLGRQPGTRLVENVIHDVPPNAGRAESNGMFLDEGSDQLEIAGNTIFAVACSPLRFHRAEQVTVRNNALVLSSEKSPAIAYNRTDPQTIRQHGNRVLLPGDFDAAGIVPPVAGPRPGNAAGP